MMKSLSLLLFALLAASCSSPLELDTPRDRSLDSPPVATRVRARSIALELGVSSLVTSYPFAVIGTATIDTSGAEPVLWLTMTGTAPAGSESDMALRVLKLHLDSLVAGSSQISIVGSPADRIGAEMTMEMSPGTPEQRIPDGGSCTLSLTFTHDRANRRLSAVIAADPNPGGRSFLLGGALTLTY